MFNYNALMCCIAQLTETSGGARICSKNVSDIYYRLFINYVKYKSINDTDMWTL